MKKTFTWTVTAHEWDKYYYSENFEMPIEENIVFNMGICFRNSSIPESLDIKMQKGYTGKGRAEINIKVENTAITHSKHVSEWEKEIIFPGNQVPNYYSSYNENDLIDLPYKLTIKCELTWYGFVSCGLQPHRNLKQYAMNSELSDFVIQVEFTEFHVHKIILACQSSVFRAMFATDMKEMTENRMIITDLTVNGMKEFLKYLYSGNTEALSDYNVAVQLLAFAEKYEITDLKNLCSGALMEHLSLENVLEILDAANVHGADNLCNYTLKFMVKNQTQVMSLPDFQKFITTKPAYMFQFLVQMIGANNQKTSSA